MEPEARRPEDGLRFDPVRVGRRRSLVAPAAVVLVAVVFVGFALVKPWNGERAIALIPQTPALPTPATASAPASPSTPASPMPPAATPLALPPLPVDLASVSTSRSAWGIRAVILQSSELPRSGSASGLAERWLAVDVAAGAAWDLGATGTAATPSDDVMALGVTTPDDEMPLDVRFWRLGPGDAIHRVVPRPVRGPEAGSWLYQPDPSVATGVGGWPAGTYRIDVLLESRIVRLVTIVPGGAPAVAGADAGVGVPFDLVDQLKPFAAGPFAVTPSRPVEIDVSPHEPLDERTAWLGPATGQLEIAAIGRVAADPVVGIGLLVKPGEEIVDAHLERVAPVVDTPDVRTFPLPPIPRSDFERAAAVLLEYDGPQALEPGLYHLATETKLAAGGTRADTWNIELVPSTPPPPPGMPLSRMARWVPLMSDLDQLAGEPLVSNRDMTGDGGTCGGSAHIGTSDELFGIVVDPGTVVRHVRMQATDVPIAADTRIRVAPNVVDGMSLVALPGGGIGARRYLLIVDTTRAGVPERLVYTVCVT